MYLPKKVLIYKKINELKVDLGLGSGLVPTSYYPVFVITVIST